VLNWIWLGLVGIGVLWAAFTGNPEDMAAVSKAVTEEANDAVKLIIGFVGSMVFFLGLMRVVQDAGFLDTLARWLRPVLNRLFPDVPPDHPAMGAMIMNIASNMLGLGNAATPFGLKAMEDLDELNPHPGVATDAMVLFLAINTSAVTLFPLGTIAVRSSLGAANPSAILLPTLMATILSTATAILMAFALRRLGLFRVPTAKLGAGGQPREASRNAKLQPEAPQPNRPSEPPTPREKWTVRAIVWGVCSALGIALVLDIARRSATQTPMGIFLDMAGIWLLPLLVITLLLIGVAARVRVYESVVEGGKEGLFVAMRIVPYIVAILVAVGVFRASGALDALTNLVRPLTSLIGMPSEALPMALMRPLSGGGAFALMMDIMGQPATGPDTFVGMLVSTLQGSTETTFYVLALYFGAAGISNGRHALAACLTADAAGILGAVAACHLFFPQLG